MTDETRRARAEFREWTDRFVWMDPTGVRVDGAELHWRKISPDTARESFRVLGRMEPHLKNAEIRSEADRLRLREKLAGITDRKGDRLFDEDALRYFDLYFGSARIRVASDRDGYDVVNGRHRLWLAAKEAVPRLPVLLAERVGSRQPDSDVLEDSTVDDIGLNDIESEAREQLEEAGKLNDEIERHQDRVEKWADAVKDLKNLQKELPSEEIEKAESAAEKAKAETERRLQELNEQREQLLEENHRMAEKVSKAYEQRSKALDKVGIIEAISGEASGELRSDVAGVRDALMQDMGRLAEVDRELAEARQKLESS